MNRSTQAYTICTTEREPIKCVYKYNEWIMSHKTSQGHGKAKSRSHNDVAYLQSLRDVPIKYQLPTPYSF